MKVYARPEDGLRDAMRLGEGMTHKWAVVDMDFGGGKAVLALSHPVEGEERVGLLRRYARLLNSLQGSFSTGEDLGTTPEDMLVLSRESRWVHGYDPERDRMRDPGPYTALGVFEGIRAAVRHVWGGGSLRGRSVLIQGVGDVGEPLARLCADAGATLLLSDLDAGRCERVAAETGATVVAADAARSTACDVYAPCAVGATLSAETIPGLACRIVGGSANNQLEVAEDAERLHERGILYAPDYVINGGGATAFGLRTRGEEDDGVLRARVRAVGDALGEIFAEAAEANESPLNAASRRVQRNLSRKRNFR
jgi:leucine dehydrogenase